MCIVSHTRTHTHAHTHTRVVHAGTAARTTPAATTTTSTPTTTSFCQQICNAPSNACALLLLRQTHSLNKNLWSSYVYIIQYSLMNTLNVSFRRGAESNSAHKDFFGLMLCLVSTFSRCSRRSIASTWRLRLRFFLVLLFVVRDMMDGEKIYGR